MCVDAEAVTQLSNPFLALDGVDLLYSLPGFLPAP